MSDTAEESGESQSEIAQKTIRGNRIGKGDPVQNAVLLNPVIKRIPVRNGVALNNPW